MGRALVIILALFLITPTYPVFAGESEFSTQENLQPALEDDRPLPNIFIWTTEKTTPQYKDFDEQDGQDSDYLTDEEVQAIIDKRNEQILKAQEVLATAHKSRIFRKQKEELPHIQISDDEEISAAVLKGYAEYIEGVNDVYLKDDYDNLVFNIKKPQRLDSSTISLSKSGVFQSKPVEMGKFNNEEYKISSWGGSLSEKIGNFEFGTKYSTDVDTSQLEYTSGLFAKYTYKKASISTSHSRTIGTTKGKYSDSFSVEPALKLNEIFTIREKLSANTTYNIKSAEFILSITPFGKRKDDRLNFELGAKHSFNQQNEMYRSQFRFSTVFKL